MNTYTEALIAEAIEDFSFSNYGLDIVEDSDPEWIKDLASHILKALHTDPKDETRVKPHLIAPHGADYGEIAEVSYEDAHGDINFYYVWTKAVSDEPES